MTTAQIASIVWTLLAALCLFAREPLWEAGICFVMSALSDIVHALRQIRDRL